MRRFLASCLIASCCFFSQSQVVLKDIFGRDLSGRKITLVDWEGYMANPAIRLTLTPSSSPLTATILANEPRLYFNTPSTAGTSGPAKSLSFSNTNPLDFYLSIFPDRSGGDETYTLNISTSAGTQTFLIEVIDQDPVAPVFNFSITVDYSQDQAAYNFFSNAVHKNIVNQAVNDWAYFIGNMNFDAVPAGTQQTWIWNDDFSGGNWVSNSTTYNGFLLYAYGIHTTPHRSGGEASSNSFQTIAGSNTALRRSGGYEAEVHGNYNTLGWNTLISGNNWYQATNFGNVQNDLYSIALHETGHALCFNPAYPKFQQYKSQGYVDDPNVVAYHGTTVPLDASDHMTNGQTADPLKLVDRVSKKGVFGSEYAQFVPYGRWLITRLNLEVLRAIGYNIRATSAFKPVTIVTTSLVSGAVANAYSSSVQAQGGIPFYKYALKNSSLPPGLILNSFDGVINGTPTQAGLFTFTVEVTDYDQQTAEKTLSILIDPYIGLIEYQASDGLMVRPNPFQHSATITLSESGINSRLHVLNSLGQKIMELHPSADVFVFERRDLPAGIYFLLLTNRDILISREKIVISD